MATEQIPDAAKIGKMYVTQVSFQWCEAGQSYNNDTCKYDKYPGHWEITATISDKPTRHGNGQQTMNFKVEQGVGQKLAECLVPVVMADAARKAEQLAADSKAMIQALGDRTLACIANGANNDAPND